MPRGVSRYDEARLQGRLWTPNFKPFTQIAFDLQEQSAISFLTGTTISQVADLSGKGRHLTGAGSSTNLQIAGFTAGNAIGNVLSQPASRYGYTTISGSFSATSLIIAFLSVNDANLNQLFDMRNSSNSSPLLDDNSNSGYGSRARNDAGNLQGTSSTRVTGVWDIHAASWNPPNVYERLNGAQVGSSNPVTGSMTGLNRLGVFANGDTLAASGVQGSIACLYVLNDYSQIFNIEGFIAWKWGLVNRLAASHPFKNRPPLIGD